METYNLIFDETDYSRDAVENMIEARNYFDTSSYDDELILKDFDLK